jgi:hypothetical protein
VTTLEQASDMVHALLLLAMGQIECHDGPEICDLQQSGEVRDESGRLSNSGTIRRGRNYLLDMIESTHVARHGQSCNTLAALLTHYASWTHAV